MKTILSLILCVMMFTACTKNKDNPSAVLPTTAETYKFKSIDYSIENAGDGVQQVVVPTPSLVFKNATSLTQSVRFSPTENFKETSYFKSDDKNAFNLVNMDTVKVSVPLYITGNTISLGPKKWLYSDKQTELPPLTTLKDSVSVTSNAVATVKIDVILRKFTTTYTAVFEGKTTGKLVSVKGTWVGTAPAGANVGTQYEAIK